LHLETLEDRCVPAVTLTAAPIGPVEGAPFTATVATFTANDPAPQATTNFSIVSVDWGDGNSSPVDGQNVGIVLDPNVPGQFDVIATHAYGEEGTFTVTVTVLDKVDNTTATTGPQAVAVADAPLAASNTNPDGTAAPVVVPQGVTASNVTVATFTDAAPEAAASYSALIDWGDGSPASAGTVMVSGGTLTVCGSHTYATPGRFTITTAVTDDGGSTASVTASATVGSDTERLLAQAYQDLLQRPIDPDGLAFWAGQVEAGVPVGQVALALEATPEFLTGQVEAAFGRLLNRPADPDSLTFFVGFLGSGGTVEQMDALLAGSAEYFQGRGGGRIDHFLDALYQDALGRPPDPSGRATSSRLLAAGDSPGHVAALVFGSAEFQADQVGNFFQQFLLRGADAAGLSAFAGMPDDLVIAGIISSPEYAARV
jgi:hypothetical protein